ncbi:bifunctional DNA primase/polymerase [Streptomyces decoyicus]|uniref:bifunctional DNA primase/polymerase n=1 Tax=Streptomyces decoyicus TaxID=249567 RepID=UPI00365F5E1B
MTHYVEGMGNPFYSSALAAANRGWSVFPLWPGAKQPALHGEQHCSGTGDCSDGHAKWEQRATDNPLQLERAWEHGAEYNVGVATGPSGLVVVDLDMPKDNSKGDMPDGMATFQALCERAGQPVPSTYTVRTASGGRHLYFTAPAGVRLGNTAGKLGPLIDTRAWGGYVVAEGSVMPDGTYEVINSEPVTDLPPWLLDQLRPALLPAQRPVRISLHSQSRSNRYLRSAVEEELQRVTSSSPGQHNTALYRASVALGQLVAGGALAAHEVTEWLALAGTSVGQGDREARATIASGLRAGAKRPRRVAS